MSAVLTKALPAQVGRAVFPTPADLEKVVPSFYESTALTNVEAERALQGIAKFTVNQVAHRIATGQPLTDQERRYATVAAILRRDAVFWHVLLLDTDTYDLYLHLQDLLYNSTYVQEDPTAAQLAPKSRQTIKEVLAEHLPFYAKTAARIVGYHMHAPVSSLELSYRNPYTVCERMSQAILTQFPSQLEQVEHLRLCVSTFALRHGFPIGKAWVLRNVSPQLFSELIDEHA